MTDETIREDVSQASEATEQQQAPEQEAPKSPSSKREAMMARVAESAREKREADRKAMALINDPDLSEEEYDSRQAASSEQQELDQGTTDGDEDENAPDAHAPEGEDQPSQEEEQPAAAVTRPGWHAREDGTLVKRLKVNGETVEMTEEEYDRAVSKELAGDQKLRLAAERQRVLDEREARLAEQERAPRELPQGQSAEELQAKLKKYHDAVYDGNTDEANAIFQDILDSGRQSSTPNLEALVDQAATRARTAMETERLAASAQRGWTKFATDYSAIADDDANLAYADAILKQVKNENPDWEPEQVILETGRLAAERLGLAGKKGQDAPVRTDASSTAERRERKANLTPVPKATTTAHRPEPKPQLDMSPAAKIARLRAGRAV